jgi:membrane protein YdbS with pleckstrin-like domain
MRGRTRGPDERDGKDGMGYTESLLATNEKIVYRSKQHWIAPIFGTVAGVLVLVGGVALFIVQQTIIEFDGALGFLNTLILWASLALVIVGVAMVGYSYIQWWVEDYAVTNQKVMKVAGLLRKRTSGAALEKINDVVMEQGPLGRMLGYGTLRVSTASDSSDLTYETMRNPAEFRRSMLDEKMEWEAADARLISAAVRETTAPTPAPAPEVTMPAPVAAAPAPAVPTVDEKLRSLAKLRDDGIISPGEFEAKKAELLADL